MHTRFYRTIALVTMVGWTVVFPVRAMAEQSTVTLLTLIDGTACRGPITGTTFNLVDLRANYACTDGRWILGDPFTMGDGRQIALLANTILAGQRVSDDADPCQQPTCITSVGQAEVATWASLPRRLSLLGGSNKIKGSRACAFVDGQTFFVGTARANYQCDPTYWRNLSGAAQDEEYWILDGPMPVGNDPNTPTVIFATVLRQNVSGCEQAVCVLSIQQLSAQLL
jgi:hypothetical protein